MHSFKGGVGRTLHALALAKAIAEKKEKSVLLIDADLEAPGITWLLKNRMPNPDISFADAVTLLHGASDSEIQVENTLRLIADRVQHSCLDNIYVLPGFRSPEQFTSLLIKPEHLIRNAENPYIITHSLSQLGRMLGVSAVIADLRAGLSEFSTGFLLDRRVHQIFVTTSNPQSVQGTKYLLRLIRESTHLKPCSPKLIFSQVPFDKYLKEKGAIAEDMEERLGVRPGNIILTPHEERFTEFGHSWDEIMQHLDKSELFSVMLRWLPIFTLAQDIPFVNPENFTETEKEKAELTESLAVI